MTDNNALADVADEIRLALKLLDNVTATDSTADDLGCAELALHRALERLAGPVQKTYQSAKDCPLGEAHGMASTHGGPNGEDLCDFCGFLAQPVQQAGGDQVERVAIGIAQELMPSAAERQLRWPKDRLDTLSGRDGTVPYTWDFAERCREIARAALAAMQPALDGEG